MFRIIEFRGTRRGKTHLYQSRKKFDQMWKFHSDFVDYMLSIRRQGDVWTPHLEGYELGGIDPGTGKPDWTLTRRYPSA